MLHIHVMPLGSYHTNCYLVYEEASDACVVIDPGFTPHEVYMQAKTLGKTIEAILLTHGHFDHVGGVRELAADTGCRVYMCREDTAMPPQLTAGPIYFTDTYGEGDVLELAGTTFRVLHTPGHTQGSVCLCAEDAMFSGDTLFRETCGRTDLPGGSFVQIRQSLKRLAGIEKNYNVYPGHGEATTLDAEKQYNPYMQ